MCVRLCIPHHVGAGTLGVQERVSDPWSWSDRWLWAAPCGCWELKPSALQYWQVLLTTEQSSLRLFVCFLKDGSVPRNSLPSITPLWTWWVSKHLSQPSFAARGFSNNIAPSEKSSCCRNWWRGKMEHCWLEEPSLATRISLPSIIEACVAEGRFDAISTFRGIDSN